MLLQKEFPFAFRFHSAEYIEYAGKDGFSIPTAGVYRILFCVDGSVSVNIGKEHCSLGIGDVFVAFPNVTVSAAENNGSGGLYIIEFFMLATDKIGFDSRHISSPMNVRLLELVKYLIAMSENDSYTVEMRNSCLSLIITEISNNSNNGKQNHSKTLLINEIRLWLKMNVILYPDLIEAAALKFGYSKNHIIRLFKQIYGQSVHEYINEIKIGMAVNLLMNSNRSVEKIASDLKFPSADSFIKFFKYHRSMTPGAFRKSIMEENGGTK